MLVSPEEKAQLVKARELSQYLLAYARKVEELKKKEEEIRAGPPPAGYLYHCKYCLLGTNCSDRVCCGCAFT